MSNLRMTELVADPPAIVASEQLATFRIGFTVPNSTYIPYGLIEVSPSLNGIPTPTHRSSLSNHFTLPLYAGDYTFNTSYIFPSTIWGHVRIQMNVYNESGTQLICTQWTVYATGTSKNETGWPLSSLYI
jgi:hypothetical protein